VRFHVQRPPKPVNQWSEADKELLRRFNSYEVVSKLGCSLKAVYRARREFGIRAPRHTIWTPGMDGLLGTMPDKELAARLNRSVTAIKVRRARLAMPMPNPKYRPGTPEEEALLGTAKDAVIAARLGRRVATTAARRHKLGIRPAIFVHPKAWSADE